MLAYLCKWIGVFSNTKGIINPAAPSLVVFGVNLSAIKVTFTLGSLSKIQTAEERPIIPPPTTATDAMTFLLSNHKPGTAQRETARGGVGVSARNLSFAPPVVGVV